MARPSQPSVTRLPRRPRRLRTFTASRSRFRARRPRPRASNTTMTPPLGSNSTRTAPTHPPRLIPRPRLRCTPKSPRARRRPLRARRHSCPPPSIHPAPHRVHSPPSLPLLQNTVLPIPFSPRTPTPQTPPTRTPLPIPLLPPPPTRPIRHTAPPLPTQLLPHSVPLPPHHIIPPQLMFPLHTRLTMHIQPLHPLTPTLRLPPLQRRLSLPNRTHTLHPITCPHLLPHPHMPSMIPGLVQRTRAKHRLHRFADIYKSRIPGT